MCDSLTKAMEGANDFDHCVVCGHESSAVLDGQELRCERCGNGFEVLNMIFDINGSIRRYVKECLQERKPSLCGFSLKS